MSVTVVKSAEIAGSPAACLAALQDFASYPAWQSAVRSAEVRDADPDAGSTDVAFEVDLGIAVIHYALRYVVASPELLTWSRLEGDARRIDGEYRLEELRPGLTRATYALDIDLGIPLPGIVARRVAGMASARSVQELRTRVEATC
jgi:ribosome-associated toxin RatA of RatAB toxin-antitoxin module